MIDMKSEKLVPVLDAVNFVPRPGGRPLHISTLYRWINTGVRGVRLESVVLGGGRYTSREAVERFCRGTTEAAKV